MTTYLVRQYRPAYFTGFTNQVVRDVAYDDITKVPWAESFKHAGFSHFAVEPYHGDELIISAHYTDGKHWVMGFALPMDSEAKAPDGGLLCDNWRYREHES
jgi:hypothetical protein